MHGFRILDRVPQPTLRSRQFGGNDDAGVGPQHAAWAVRLFGSSTSTTSGSTHPLAAAAGDALHVANGTGPIPGERRSICIGRSGHPPVLWNRRRAHRLLLREQGTSCPRPLVARTCLDRPSPYVAQRDRSSNHSAHTRLGWLCRVPRPGLAAEAHCTTLNRNCVRIALPPSPPANTVRPRCLAIPHGKARGGDAETRFVPPDRPEHP